MYELSVAQELYSLSRARADEIGARELESVRVSVGQLAGVNTDLLRSAWTFVTSESADDRCRIVIDMTPGRQVCPQCGSTPSEEAQHPTYCERCKCHLRVESGGKVEVMEIRFAQELVVA